MNNRNLLNDRFWRSFAIPFLLLTPICLVVAEPTEEQKLASQSCQLIYAGELQHCTDTHGPGVGWEICVDLAEAKYEDCCKKVTGGKCVSYAGAPIHHRPPGPTPPPGLGPTVPPRGPSAPPGISKPKPTPTPKRGPSAPPLKGGHTPTPIPSGPTLLSKPNKPTPTPSPKKDHHG